MSWLGVVVRCGCGCARAAWEFGCALAGCVEGGCESSCGLGSIDMASVRAGGQGVCACNLGARIRSSRRSKRTSEARDVLRSGDDRETRLQTIR